MIWGKSFLLAMGMAAFWHCLLLAGEVEPLYHADTEGLTSLRKNAVVSVGGEVRVDYSYRQSKSSGSSSAAASSYDVKTGDLSVRNANLRILADVHPNIQAFFKLDFSSNPDRNREYEEILAEAMLVAKSVGGTGLGFFAGKGRVPYGQDIALGMIQSYHHAANRAESSEGPLFLSNPRDKTPGAALNPLPSGPPMRPGQIERAVVAGASYDWDDRWRVELAVFKPNDSEYESWVVERRGGRYASNIGAAARMWWRPTEELTIEASGMAARSNAMGRPGLRGDVDASARGAKTAYAVSLGFDWRRGPWRVFGEYQHGWDWNFTRGYDTDTWQIGAAREFADGWRVGGMVEGLHIRDRSVNAVREKVSDDFYKLALNVRYTFSSGFFLLAEYGHEWFSREGGGVRRERRQGDFVGVRAGLSF